MRTHGILQVSRGTASTTSGLYRRLLLEAPSTGRCPVLLLGHALESLRSGWDPAPALAELDRRDAAAVLAERYPSGCVFHASCLAPFGATFPGLAAATPGLGAADAGRRSSRRRSTRRRSPGEPLLALVPVARPADVPAAVGWTGAAGLMGRRRGGVRGAAQLGGPVRRGAGRMGRATLELAVAAPPWERSECLAIAAEHYAFCDDTYQGNPGTLRDYANLLRGSTRWSFWWD